MNLIALFASGQAEITVNGLHQWDYGRKLEIHLDKALATVEVHFACAGMDEAVVRVCEATEGVAVATIPDKCLEQTTPITAWVFEIDGTTGLTTKKITLPIIARTRPSVAGDIPTEVSDKYTEAVTAMNAAVEAVAKGDLKVSNAGWADVAGLANDTLRAQTAKEADHATTADSATKATTADSATTATTAQEANYALNAQIAEIAGTAATLDHLYCHIITIDIPRYSSTTSTTLMDTVRLIFHITSPNKTYTASNALTFLEAEVGKSVYCETIYIDTQSNYAEHYAGYVNKGEQATGWYRIDLVAWDGDVELGGYYNSYTPSVTTIQIY